MRHSEPAVPVRAGVIAAALLVVGAIVWTAQGPAHRPPVTATAIVPAATVTPAAVRTSPESGERGAPAGITPLETPGQLGAPTGLGVDDRASKTRPRSPLEQSPGYYPPDDPESMSVITGRREAPLVDLELAGGAESMDALGRAIVAALNARNEGALHALRVTREEFEVILWREFPESRPVTRITADDAWQMSHTQSIAGATGAVGLLGGGHLEFIRVDSPPPTPYRNFILHRGVEVVARDAATTSEVRIHCAPSFVERHGRYKVLTFKD